jgi:hypothetical protein
VGHASYQAEYYSAIAGELAAQTPLTGSDLPLASPSARAICSRLDQFEDFFMIARRSLIVASVALLGSAVAPHALAAPPAGDDPVAIANAIYTRVTKGKGNSGGIFMFDTRAAKAKYLSKSLIELWAKVDARTKKGDAGPPGFDPVTNSQDPDVKSFKVLAEKSEPDKATIAVTIKAQHSARKMSADETISYYFVREAGGWKIDDIKGTVDGKPWSLRQLFVNYLKLFR